MTIPGYDPQDLERTLSSALEGEDVDDYLDPDERARYEDGEPLVDLFSFSDISALLGLDAEPESTPDHPTD